MLFPGAFIRNNHSGTGDRRLRRIPYEACDLSVIELSHQRKTANHGSDRERSETFSAHEHPTTTKSKLPTISLPICRSCQVGYQEILVNSNSLPEGGAYEQGYQTGDLARKCWTGCAHFTAKYSF